MLPLLYPQLVWRIPTDEKKIYLTFDDGPVSGPTDYAFEQLSAFRAKATFFCIGENVDKHTVLFHQIRNHGHAIGNHTYNHLKGWGMADQTYKENVRMCQNVIGETSLFRPPYGRIKRSQIKALKDYKIIMWDVLSYDYLQTLNEEKCLKGVIGAIRPGSIVVFHDSYKAEKNMQYVLPRVLDHFANRNFVFDSLPEF